MTVPRPAPACSSPAPGARPPPAGARLAHKSGTSITFEGVTAAHNDIGILSWPDGHTLIVAAFLTASPAPEQERDAIFAALARDIASELHP